jgi:hypothetical protein
VAVNSHRSNSVPMTLPVTLATTFGRGMDAAECSLGIARSAIRYGSSKAVRCERQFSDGVIHEV